MYSHYIPTSGGSYRRETVETPEPETAVTNEQTAPKSVLSQLSLGSEDCLVLAVLLLAASRSEGRDQTAAMITALAFALLR